MSSAAVARRARILSMLVLVLSVVPLGSVYTLIATLFQDHQQEKHDGAFDATSSETMKSVTDTTLLAALSSLEESLRTVWFHSQGPATAGSVTTHSTTVQLYYEYLQRQLLLAPSFNTSTHSQHHQVQQQVRLLIIQGELSILFAITVPLGISLLTSIVMLYYSLWLGPRQQQQQKSTNFPGRPRQRQVESVLDKRQRKQKIIEMLVRYRKELIESDCRISEEEVDQPGRPATHGAKTCDGGEKREHDWWIPMAGTQWQEDGTITGERPIIKLNHSVQAKCVTTSEISSPFCTTPNTETKRHPTSKRLLTEPCAICLMDYQCGDALVWSLNSNCVHCFHEQVSRSYRNEIVSLAAKQIHCTTEHWILILHRVSRFSIVFCIFNESSVYSHGFQNDATRRLFHALVVGKVLSTNSRKNECKSSRKKNESFDESDETDGQFKEAYCDVSHMPSRIKPCKVPRCAG
jgi:hypothetical protein